ncbi:hypothetical protein [Burkholderia gladioli]|nr:hypothetical protein [Burkholderia gladioli]
MKPLIYLAACVGAAVMALSLAGALGIGHFRLYYGADEPHCVRGVST